MIHPSKAFQFVGKSVLVTGAGSGIGAAVAQSFGAAGARVAVHYSRNRDGAEAVAAVIRQAGGQAITLPLHCAAALPPSCAVRGAAA